MSYFAQINENNEVIQVNTIYLDSEAIELQWLETHLGGRWVKTSQTIDGEEVNFVSKGMVFDESKDIFLPKQPYPSWTLNENTLMYEAPTPRPIDDKFYRWNEETTSWEEVI